MITNRNVKVLTVFAALLVGFSSFADEVSNTYTTTYVVHTNESSFEIPRHFQANSH